MDHLCAAVLGLFDVEKVQVLQTVVCRAAPTHCKVQGFIALWLLQAYLAPRAIEDRGIRGATVPHRIDGLSAAYCV